jgi:GT2 family glycosyltransferase
MATMPEAPEISVLVVTYQSRQWIRACLDSIYESRIDVPFEVIVVDNASTDGTQGELTGPWADRSNFRSILLPKNTGFAAGNMRGYEQSRGRYILLLNPDAALPPDGMRRMLDFLRESPDVGVVGPKILIETGEREESFRRFPSVLDVLIKRTALRDVPAFQGRLNRYLMRDRDPDATQEVGWVQGACMMLPRGAIDDLETLFDERFFLFYEEIDLCRRLWEAGWRVVYLPTVEVFHQSRRLSAGSIPQVFRRSAVQHLVLSAWKYHWKWAFRRRRR